MQCPPSRQWSLKAAVGKTNCPTSFLSCKFFGIPWISFTDCPVFCMIYSTIFCWFVAVSFGHRTWLINVYCWWRTLPVSRQDPLGCVRRPSSPSHSDFGQRLVVVTTERADELNLFELVHSEVVSLYLVAYTCIFPTQRWLNWQIKLYFIWWSPIRRPGIQRSNYKVQGTWKAGRVTTIVIWDNLSIYMLVLQYTSIYIMVRFWVDSSSLVDSFHRTSTQSQFQALALYIYIYTGM